MANHVDPEEDAQRRRDVFEHLCASLPTLDASVKNQALTLFNSLEKRASPDDLHVRIDILSMYFMILIKGTRGILYVN